MTLDIQEPTTLNVPETLQLTATILPATTTDKTLTWSSSDSAVATVDANGKVTAVKAGEATITVTATSGKSATLKVTVLQPSSGVEIDFAASGIEGNDLTLNVGEIKTIAVKVTPADSTDSLTWTSSNEAIATVDANGTVTAVKAGEATITVTTTSGKSATLKVTVLQPALGIEVSEEDIDLEVGETAQLTATILPDDSTDTEVVWETSDASIATVDANGLVTGIALGETEITVSVKANKLNALSGVYMIWSDSGNRPDIYSINGMLVKKGCSLEDYMRLEPGIYIVGGQKILKR